MTDHPTPDPATWAKSIRQIVDAIKLCPDVVDRMDDIVELALTEATLEHVKERIIDLTEIPDDLAGLEDEWRATVPVTREKIRPRSPTRLPPPSPNWQRRVRDAMKSPERSQSRRPPCPEPLR